ncbi:MAG: hypothetical protein A49_26770 [Methyloceanibacter sp.]|nr:MAG: hypothetical protein A49_26770 [Methyloceanibacter sp.]
MLVGLIGLTTSVQAGPLVDTNISEFGAGQTLGWITGVDIGIVADEFSFSRQARLVGEELFLDVLAEASGEIYHELTQEILHHGANPLVSTWEFAAGGLDLGGGLSAHLQHGISGTIDSSNEIFLEDEMVSQFVHLFGHNQYLDFLGGPSSIVFEDWWEGEQHLFHSTTTFVSQVSTHSEVVPEPATSLLLGGGVLLLLRRSRV